MEIRRYISTRIWGESWFEPLTATEKLIWIYLLTNPATNMLGIYGLTVRRIGYIVTPVPKLCAVVSRSLKNSNSSS